MFIAITGPTGVGKTTLAGRLAARLDATLMLDPFADNPYLPQLYAAAGRAADDLALKVELTFIALRVAQLRQIQMITGAGGRVVADWAMVQQRIFASATLPPADVARVAKTCGIWSKDSPSPDVVIGLTAPPSMLLHRVRQRGRAMEVAVSEANLAALNEAFQRTFTSHVIHRDGSTFDALNDEDLYELIAQLTGSENP
ncbi:deoxynucleoside kinase [Micromonospora sp. RP3T]|uniref:deoxynucleoside kinase n=1 Tax=Micromonospora sp. RP3T TaxID=2135446 RepID=UPI003D755116